MLYKYENQKLIVSKQDSIDNELEKDKYISPVP
jgi:hypothetical protein